MHRRLMLLKGRLSFNQFIPNKRHRFGIKLFIICDSETGYVLKIIIYFRKTARVDTWSAADVGKSSDIVMTLMSKYLTKGHNLFVDNWYTGVKLFQDLSHNLTNACGTVKRKKRP